MELDGYCEPLAIAFEHHGVQHYEHQNYFHKGRKTFAARAEADIQKQDLCIKHGVRLLVIPEVPSLLPLSKVRLHLLQELKRLHIQIPKDLETQIVDLRPAYLAPKGKLMIETLQQLAHKRGGALLATDYTNTHSSLLWRCSRGHEWSAVPSSIKRGSWCPVCSGHMLSTIDEMNRIAASRGGRCLSKQYVNDSTKLRWECGDGHQWETKPTHIKQGHWCGICARKKVSATVRAHMEVKGS